MLSNSPPFIIKAERTHLTMSYPIIMSPSAPALPLQPEERERDEILLIAFPLGTWVPEESAHFVLQAL